MRIYGIRVLYVMLQDGTAGGGLLTDYHCRRQQCVWEYEKGVQKYILQV